MSIFKDCDIRGVYGKELFEADGYRVGRALSTLVPSARIRVGGDVRLSTPALKARLVEGLVAGGARVEDMGTIATPMMYFAIHGGAADGGA
ncbi:MAG: phosphomannomutase, partial [Eubacteriales bacterium]|nr:phosphomannomutase [Eubacteriales bacterium]